MIAPLELRRERAVAAMMKVIENPAAPKQVRNDLLELMGQVDDVSQEVLRTQYRENRAI